MSASRQTRSFEHGVPWGRREGATRPLPAFAGKLAGKRRAEIAIIGGGFSGLSAAYHLVRSRPGRDIVLLEARRLGSGASGRNTGMAGPGVQGSISLLRSRHGDAVASRAWRGTTDAVDALVTLVRDEKLDCELEVTGQLKVATTRWQASALRRQARAFDELGFAVPYLDAADVRAAIGSDAYHGALRYTHGALVQPARLCEELGRVSLEAGVEIHEQSPVQRITPGRPARIEAETGLVEADQVVVATNGYTAQLGFLEGQVWPLHSHVLMTEPLSATQLSGLGWPGREGIIDSRNFFSYYRLTADNRIVFGGGRVHYRPARGDRGAGGVDLENPRVYPRLERELTGLFPALAGVPIASRWAGTMGLTIDQLPLITELAPGVLYVGAWSGHGVGLATASGALVAEHLEGRRSRRSEVPWVRPAAPRLPRDPWRALGLAAYTRSLDLGDRLGAALERARPKARRDARGVS